MFLTNSLSSLIKLFHTFSPSRERVINEMKVLKSQSMINIHPNL